MGLWQVKIETSGGLSGRGLGGFVIDADGRIEASTEQQECPARLTPEELESIARAVLRSKPAAWRPSYQRAGNLHGGADQFQYTLSL
ncbi:MAG TPA: hypothetical protein VNB23_01020, partial [Ramlibacter sp.]|nr:hypothetical protein [Ramlibacter sp.]